MGKIRNEEEEGEAIKALGSLFKLTLRHLWDDGSTDSRLVSLFDEQSGIFQTKSIDDTSGIAKLRSDEMGLIDDMKAMGLPVSFQTNKKWKTRSHRKKGIKDNVMFREEDKEVESLCMENDFVQSIPVEESHELLGSGFLGNEDRDSLLTSETKDSQSCKLDDNYDSGDWNVYWDTFYERRYFYNIKTEESRWEPPAGLEHLAYSDEIHNLNELAIETTEKPHDDLVGRGPPDVVPIENFDDLGGVCQIQCETEGLEEVSSLVDTHQEASIENQSFDISTLEEEGNGEYVVKSIRKAKDKKRRTRANKIFSSSNKGTRTEGVLDEYSPIVDKYWGQRYALFSRFDDGIKMDDEGWFSVTPETLAKYHASRCNDGIVIDCFTGVGGNAIQFASRSHYVIAVDLDPKKLDLAKHNAAIYGVADKIDFVKGDFFDLAPNLKADTVFLSPPWGGPDYIKASPYDMNTMLKPRDGNSLFKAAMSIASTIIMYLPRNVDINQLAEIALSTSPPWSLEVEKNYLNGKLKAITAYYFKPDCC